MVSRTMIHWRLFLWSKILDVFFFLAIFIFIFIFFWGSNLILFFFNLIFRPISNVLDSRSIGEDRLLLPI
jgi:hypothetical protein